MLEAIPSVLLCPSPFFLKGYLIFRQEEATEGTVEAKDSSSVEVNYGVIKLTLTLTQNHTLPLPSSQS